jgi:hypothetical protein
MLPSDFFRRNVVLSFQEDAIGIRLRDVIGPDNMMWDNMTWGSDYPQSERRFRNRARSWRRSWPGCRTTNRPSLPRTPIRGSPAATPPACTILTWRGSPSLLEEPTSLRIDELGIEISCFQSGFEVEAALAELTIIPAEMPDSSIHGMRIGLCFRRSLISASGQLRAIPAREVPARSDPAANPAATGCRPPKAAALPVPKSNR